MGRQDARRRGPQGRDGGRGGAGDRQPAALAGHHAVEGQEEGQGHRDQAAVRLGPGRPGEGHRHLHAAVRDDDRRRPADRAVPRHPGVAVAEQELPEGALRGQGRRRAGLDVHGRAEEAPDGLRRPLLQPHRRRRSGRHPRHHPDAPGGLHREGDEAQVAGQGRDGLPHLDLVRRGARRHRAPVEGHPGLREHVQGLRRRRAAEADADRHQLLQRLHRSLRDHHGRHRRHRGRLPRAHPHQTRARSSSTSSS